MRVCFVLVAVAVAVAVQAVSVPMVKHEPSVVEFISFPAPVAPSRAVDYQWEAVLPTDSNVLLGTQEMLQEDEGGVSVEVSPPSAITCSAENGCSCRHQYYFNHLDVRGCQVFVPEQYHKSDFRCQFFVQGGAVFLYGDSWKKAVNSPVDTDTYFCDKA